jgi:DNA-directed RNA polymerase subunit omega
MSIIDPSIDELLDKVSKDRFMLCAIASKRARDINDMATGQKNRALALHTTTTIKGFSGRKSLSLAMEEIDSDELGYVDKDAPEDVTVGEGDSNSDQVEAAAGAESAEGDTLSKAILPDTEAIEEADA